MSIRQRMKLVGWQAVVLAGLLAIAPAAHAAHAALGASVTLKTGSPGTISPGQPTILQITLSNNSTTADITGVGFSNSLPGTLPNGLKIAGAATYTCTDPSIPSTSAGTGTLTAGIGTQAITLAAGTIPLRANGTDGVCVIEIPVSAGTSDGSGATYTYTIANGAVVGNDGSGVANLGVVNQSINVSAMSRPVITKSFANNAVVLGGAGTTLTIKVDNPSSVALPNFTITDAFPQLGGQSIIEVAGTPASTSSCTGSGTPATFTPAAGDVSVSASGGTVAANGSCTMTVAVVAKQTNGLYDTGSQSNIINRTTQFSNDLGIVPASNATASIRARSPLAITKAFANSFLSTGQSGSFTITLTNNSGSALTVTTLDDNPIDSTAGIGSGLLATSGSTSCVGGAVSLLAGGDGIRLTGGVIPANGSCTVTVNFDGTVQTAGQPISYTNTIAEGAVGLVGAPPIVSQLASAAILVADDLRVLKTGSPASVAPGNPVLYTVTVQNFGTTPQSNVVVTDTFTNGQSYLTGTVNGLTYTPSLSAGCGALTESSVIGDTNATFTIATLPARANINTPGSCTITFYAMSGTGAANNSSTANQIPVNGVCYNSGATCNASASQVTSGTVSTTVLSLNKAFNLASPRPEGTITRMTLTVTNQSANALTNVVIADTLPTAAVGSGQMRVATPANASSTCGTPVITANANSTSVAMSGGTVPGRATNGTGAAGTCFLQVDVIAGAGTYTNTANVTATETYANGATHALGPISANANFTYNSSLTAIKSFSPATVSSGGKSTVTVRLSNSGAVALNNVSVTDPLPGGMVLANPSNAYSTCAGPTAVTAVAGASSVNLTGAAIAGSGNCDFIFDVVATGASNWINSIPVGNITADGGISNQSAVTATLNYNAPNNPSVIKATNPGTLTFPGQTSQLTITITNGTQAVTSLSLNDYFTIDGTAGAALNGMVVAPTPAASTTCPGGIVTATPGSTSISLAGVSLAGNAVCTVSVNISSNKIGGITNFIPIGAISNNQGLSNAGQASTSLTAQANIGITKQFTPNVIKPGERSRLRITFLNPTNQSLTALSVLDTLPAGVTVPAGANPSTTCAGATVTSPAANQVQVSGGSIAATVGGTVASCYAEIDVTAAAQGNYVNTINSGALTASAGGVGVNNSQPTSDTLRVKSPLTIHKAFSSKTLDVGNPVGFTTATDSKSPGVPLTMTLRLDNPNNVDLTGAAFTDTLPIGLVVATTPSASTTCAGGTVVAAASATEVRLAGATIPAVGSCTVTVNVLSNIPGLYTNTISAGGVTTTEGVTNEDPTRARVEISNPPKVSKQFSPAVIPPSGTSKLTIFLGNDNSTAVTLSSAFVDTLPTAPGNIVVKSPSVIGGTCTLGSVTAVAGSATVTYANGATIPAGGCTITVDVTGVTAGVHTNNIPAGDLKTNAGNNQDPANATLTISTLGYVSGKVFRDNNPAPNGLFDGTDTPISGVSIELRSGATCSGALVTQAGLTNPMTTDVVGNYVFSGLAAGTYSVCEPVQPNGTNNGITTAGAIVPVAGSSGTTGVASNPTTTSSQIVNIQLTAAGTGEVSGSTNNNFAEIVPSSISGRVFLDQNDNGVENAVDTALSSVQIELLNAANAVVATTTTDAAGNYSFANLSPGTYSVREPTQPSGTANGKTIAGAAVTGGTAGTATAQNVVPSLIATIVLPPNQASTDNNFAEVPAGRQVSGRVFLDPNQDGLFSTGESGLSGVTLNLTGNDFNGIAVSRTIQTTADGRYTFTGLPESGVGGYTVTEPNQPSGTSNGITKAGTTGGTATLIGVAPSVISGVNLAGFNTISADNNFGEILVPAPIVRTISGKVFRDNDNSGTFNGSDQGIGGQTINLVGTDIYGNTVTQTTMTAADGTYSFTGLPEGTYTVNQPAQPVGTSNGATTAGSTGGVASNPTNSSSQIVTIDLKASNTTSVNNDFAEIAEIVRVEPDLVVTKATTSSRITEGQTVTYSLRVKNVGGLATVGNYTVTDSLPATTGTPAKWTLEAAAGTGWSCAITADKLSVSCTNNVVLQPGEVNPSAIALTVKVGTGAAAFSPLRNVVLVSGGGEPEGKKPQPPEVNAPQNCGATPEFNVCQLETPIDEVKSDLVVTKTTSTKRVAEGETLSYILNVKNVGQSATVGNYTVIDTLPATTGTPAKWTLETAAGTGWSCAITADKLSVSCTNNVVLQPGEVNPSAIALTVKVGTGAAAFSPLRNVVLVSGGGEPEGKKPQPPEVNAPKTCGATPEFNVCQLETPIGEPDLVVTKTTTSQRIAEGQALSYSLSVKNVGDSATVGNYTVTDSLPATTGTPAKWTLEAAAGTGWSCAITADKLSVSCTNNVVLQPGEVNPSAIALTVKVGTGAAAFSPLRNVVLVSGGGEPEGKKPQPPEVNAPKTCGQAPEFNVCQLETPVDKSMPDMVVTKAASREVFTEGNLGSYVLRVKNAGAVPTSGVYTVTDSLPANSGTPAKWAIEGASGNGWTCGVSADQLSVSCDASAVLQPGMESPSTIAVSVRLASGAVNFGPLRNVVKVSGGGESDDKKPQPGELANPPVCSVAPEVNVCYVDTPLQRSAGLSGHVWIDGGIKKVLGTGDKPLPQWIVEVYDITDPAAQGKTFTELVRSGVAKQTFTTDSKGYYEACNLQPKSTYRVLFRDPANRIAFPGVVTNEQGRVTGSDYYSQVKEQEGFQVLEVNLPSGNGGPGCGGNGISAPEQSLPLDPNGVVYDSITRAPVSGAKVTLKPEGICTGYDPKLHIINYETYSKDAQGNPTMVTGDDGFYKFLLTGDPTAPKSCQYQIALEPPSGYKTPPSGLIPPSGPLNTPAGPGIFEVQPQKSAPVGDQSTTYHYLLLFGLNHQEVFNNHLPLDPMIAGKLVLTKQGDKRLAEVGDTVLYTINVRLLQGDPVAQATVRDRLPAGLTLVPGTVRVNGKPAPDPLGGLGPVLAFNLGAVNANAQATLTYRVRVGVGAMQGDGINRARAHGCQIASGCVDATTLLPLVGSVESNEGQHKVEISGGVFTSDACVLGKVFVDCNNNHVQDAEELGIPGVRLFFEDGRYAVSDSEGKYSRCSITPQSHVLKVDPSTLPRGSRLTTTSNRNLGDAGSLFIDLKNGELHRADFAEGSCTNAVLEQVKARRTQGEIRSVELEKPGGPPLRFQSKPQTVPQQGTDSANQPLIQPRQGGSNAR